jgi:hypothetical protein
LVDPQGRKPGNPARLVWHLIQGQSVEEPTVDNDGKAIREYLAGKNCAERFLWIKKNF